MDEGGKGKRRKDESLLSGKGKHERQIRDTERTKGPDGQGSTM